MGVVRDSCSLVDAKPSAQPKRVFLLVGDDILHSHLEPRQEWNRRDRSESLGNPAPGDPTRPLFPSNLNPRCHRSFYTGYGPFGRLPLPLPLMETKSSATHLDIPPAISSYRCGMGTPQRAGTSARQGSRPNQRTSPPNLASRTIQACFAGACLSRGTALPVRCDAQSPA